MPTHHAAYSPPPSLACFVTIHLPTLQRRLDDIRARMDRMQEVFEKEEENNREWEERAERDQAEALAAKAAADKAKAESRVRSSSSSVS